MAAFFNGFAGAHSGCVCTLSILNERERTRLSVAPLRLDVLAPERGEDSAPLHVLLSDLDGDPIGFVLLPEHVFLEREADDLAETLQIHGPERLGRS